MPESFADCAYRILRQRGKPMHYRELTNEVLRFVKSGGKTPAATLNSAMGSDRRFIRIGRGFYKPAGLGDQPTTEPIQLKASDEEDLYEPILNSLKEMIKDSEVKDCLLEITSRGITPSMEREVDDPAFYFLKEERQQPDIMGYVVEEESRVGLGLDVFDAKSRVIVEVKKNRVGITDIYQTKRYAEVFDAKYAFLISAGPLEEGIRRFIRSRPAVTSYTYSGGHRRVTFLRFDKEKHTFETQRTT